MKVISYFLPLFILISFFGCTDTSIIDSQPAKDNNTTLLKLPIRTGNSKVETIISVSETIDGAVGGTISLQDSYDGPNGNVDVEMQLVIPAGSFSGTHLLTVTLDGEYAAFSIQKNLRLQNPLLFSCSFTGLTLEPNTQYDFMFIDAANQTFPVLYDSIIQDFYTGSVAVVNARVYLTPLDSRYGWATIDGGGE